MAASKESTSPTLFEPSVETDDIERRSVYTDGACLGNPGPGGWGWAASFEEYASGAEPRTTNQRMELMAVIQALGAIEGPVEVVSDSTYVVNCFRDRWWQGWKRRGWRNSKGEPVANRDLWEPLIAEVIDRREPGAVVFRWVKGHAGEPMNEFVDGLATEAARSQQGRRAAGGSDETRS
jgi:ribonuclease HI